MFLALQRLVQEKQIPDVFQDLLPQECLFTQGWHKRLGSLCWLPIEVPLHCPVLRRSFQFAMEESPLGLQSSESLEVQTVRTQQRTRENIVRNRQESWDSGHGKAGLQDFTTLLTVCPVVLEMKSICKLVIQPGSKSLMWMRPNGDCSTKTSDLHIMIPQR